MRKVGCKALRYKVIHRFRDRFTVSELCKLLGVSRSGYYKWLNRKDCPDKDQVIADLIAECHEKAHRTYGYRRVKIDEFDFGMTVSAIAKEHGRSKGAIESRLVARGKMDTTYFPRKARE